MTPEGPPAAPRDLTAQVSSSEGTTVKLTWADPNDANIDEYQYRVRVNGGSVWDPDWTPMLYTDATTGAVTSSDATTTTYTVEGLVSDPQGYEFQVRALDTDRAEGDRAGLHSSVFGSPTTSETAPEAMTDVQHTVTGVSGGAGGTVEFTWNNPGDASINKYQYRYKCHNISAGCDNTFDDETWKDISGGGGATSHSMSIPGNAVVVFFQLRAINTNPTPALPSPATPVTVIRSNTPSSTITTPGAPAGLTATADWSDPNWNVTLSWTASRPPPTPSSTSTSTSRA